MASLNKVQLISNLGRDPEVRYTPDGIAVCNVSVATANAWNDKKAGDRMEEAEWHRVVFFGRLAEVVGEHMKKGRSIYVDGRMRTHKWKDKEGADQYTTEVVASEMQMLGSKPEDTKYGGDRGGGSSLPSPPLDDDIPF